MPFLALEIERFLLNKTNLEVVCVGFRRVQALSKFTWVFSHTLFWLWIYNLSGRSFSSKTACERDRHDVDSHLYCVMFH
jgi:hypothetical protein